MATTDGDPECPPDKDAGTMPLSSASLIHQRKSLLGRPLGLRSSRRDARYRKYQAKLYNFLERPRGPKAVVYHVIIFLMVFTCFGLSVFATIDTYADEANVALFYMETVVVIAFACEFVMRLWGAGCRSRYQGAIGRFRFARRPFCIIDIITIVASLIVLGEGSSGRVFAASALRGLRIFQILRMVRVDRRGGTWKLLGSVVWAHRQELITTLYIGFLGLILSSFLIFLVEKDVPKTKFTNYAEALWWGVITLCTVGYGDLVPATWMGKLIASFCSLMGISFFALPAGILGSGFALKVQQQQRQKHMIRRRQPAATLIQCLWRCYAADEHSCSVATWKVHCTRLPSPPISFKHNASFVMTRWPTIRRNKSLRPPSPSLSLQTREGTMRGDSIREHHHHHHCGSVGGSTIGIANTGPPPRLQTSNSQDSVAGREESSLHDLCDDEEVTDRWGQLTPRHKMAVRAIRKMKYLVARRKFREALKPYDVKDVMEQYSAGHVDLLGRVKTLQSRFDQILGRHGSKTRDVYDSKICLAARVVKVERQVEDIETKLEQLLELYLEDRKVLLGLGTSISPTNSLTPPNHSPPPPPPHAPLLEVDPPANAGGGGGNSSGKYKRTKPRPILVAKQSSEPSSPITTHYKGLGEESQQSIAPPTNKMRKRVTLRRSSINSSIPSREVKQPPLPHSASSSGGQGSTLSPGSSGNSVRFAPPPPDSSESRKTTPVMENSNVLTPPPTTTIPILQFISCDNSFDQIVFHIPEQSQNGVFEETSGDLELDHPRNNL